MLVTCLKTHSRVSQPVKGSSDCFRATKLWQYKSCYSGAKTELVCPPETPTATQARRPLQSHAVTTFTNLVTVGPRGSRGGDGSTPADGAGFESSKYKQSSDELQLVSTQYTPSWSDLSRFSSTISDEYFTSSLTPSGKFFSSRHLLAWKSRFFCLILLATTLSWSSGPVRGGSDSLPTTLSITWPAQESLPTVTEKACWCGWSSCAGPCLSCLRCVAAITVRQSTLDWDGARQQSHWPLTPQSAVTVIMIHYHITSLQPTIRQNDSFGNPLTNNSPASIFLTKQSCRLFTARLSPRWFWLHSQ